MHKKNEQGIVTLMVIFAVGIFALATALTVAVSAATELAKNRNVVKGDQAAYNAEAAATEGVKQYLAGYSSSCHCSTYTGNPSYSLINGNSTAAITITDDPVFPYTYVTGQVQNGSVIRKVVKTISWFPAGGAFNHAMLTADALDINGSVTIQGKNGTTTSVFSNTTIDLSGSALIKGDAYYVTGTVDAGTTSRVTGFTQKASQALPLPNIDQAPYAALAVSPTGQTFTNTSTAENYLKNNTRTGIIYVNNTGAMSITGNNTDFTGSLVTKGNLSLNNGDFRTGANDKAVLIVNGDLDLGGGVDITGIIFVTGRTNFVGNTTIHGTIVSLGGFNFQSGTVLIEFDPDLVAGWPSLLGLVIDTSSPPRLIKWEEK